MRAIEDVRIGQIEDVAMEGLKQIQAFFKYQGVDPAYFRKAQLGATVIGSYARLRASETNRMAVELASGKLLEAPAPTRMGGARAR